MDAARLRTKLLWFSLAAACLAADLWSKHLVFYPEATAPGFREGDLVGVIAPWWRTILVYNQGVTFGSFAWVPAWTKAALTSGVIVWMAWKLWALRGGHVAQSLSLSMIVGGALGNLYDRSLRPLVEQDTHPGVRDFLDWHLPQDSGLARAFAERGWQTHWYTSNVADVLIVCGVILLGWCLVRYGDDDDAPDRGGDQSPPTEAGPSDPSAGAKP
ncbi:MAG: signal peptidase II [Planctomycetes bacterium]|nr:signal peptidase II [Planctomycetota bacterium]